MPHGEFSPVRLQGWRIPIDAMLSALPDAASSVGKRSLLDAAQAIMTTDLYPKVRRACVGQGSIVGIAKGAGMIEPNMATMVVYLLTDLAIPRASLRRLLPLAVGPSFNCISIDTDTSTSDTVVLPRSRPVRRQATSRLAGAQCAPHIEAG